MDYIAAEEASLASFSCLTTNTIAASKSSYKQLQSTLPDKSDSPALRKCRHCGNKHLGDSSPASRQEHCKAYGNKCSKCEKSHHVPKMCRSSPRAAGVLSSPTDQRCPPSYPREGDNGVDWTGGRKEGGRIWNIFSPSLLISGLWDRSPSSY